MSYLNVLKQIENKKTSPIFLLYGKEPYFIQNLVEAISKVILSEEDQVSENLSTYDLEETPVEEVIGDAETYPFFGDAKLVIAHNPTFLQAKNISLPFEHNLEKLEQYINNPVKYSVIVFIAPYEKLDNRKRITKLLNKKATVAACNPIQEHEVSKWVENLAATFNIKIANNAYEVFETELAADLHLIQSEVKKLALYVGKNGMVTKEIAQNLISQSMNSSALRLADAVMERDLYGAISIYKDLEKMNEEPIALLGLLAFQFRMILRVKLLKQKGYSQFQIQKQIGGHPYVIKLAYQRERRFSISELEKIMDKLTTADATIKQGKMEKELVFELLLYDLIKAVVA